MKSNPIQSLLFAVLLAAGLWPGRMAAQLPVTLATRLVPSITITGAAGTQHFVQSSTNLADTNGWTTIGHVRLTGAPYEFSDTTATGPGPRFYRTVLTSLSDTNLVWIPPGTFLMGSPETEEGRSTNEGPQTLVTLTKGFFMGRFEVTRLEWYSYRTNLGIDYPHLPMAGISLVEASNYCAFVTAREAALGQIPEGWVYRLPTEAEWEYACRAGSTTPFWLGNSLRYDAIRQDAQFDGNFPYPTNLIAVGPITGSWTNVGSFDPNGFGLHDVHGNVAEYCLGSFEGTVLPPYPGGAVIDPPPTFATNPVSVVARGGFFNARGSECRSASRSRNLYREIGGGTGTGFRVVLSPVKY
jgi:formylglycine-generating enzyme required for sulfatase activity